MYPQEPYLNGPRHTWLCYSVKHVNHRMLCRLVDRCMERETTCRNLEPPLLSLRYAVPDTCRRNVDVTRARVAFGRWALPKLRREIHHKDPLVVNQALNSISDIIHDPVKAFEALQLDIHARIKDLLGSKDPFIREKCASIIETLSRQELGRKALFKKPDYVEEIVKLMKDPDVTVRIHIAMTMELMNRLSPEEIDAIWLLPIVVDVLGTEEEDDLVAVYLQVLQYMLYRDVKEEARQIGTVDILLKLMDDKKTEVSAGALACLAIITVDPVGQRLGVKLDILSRVRSKLYDERVEIHFNAATVIMNNTLLTAGKLRSLQVDILDRLLLLSACRHSREVQLHCLKALTNMCEAPPCREQLLTLQANIEAIETGRVECVDRAKAVLLAVIRWKP